jgi:hypothetical protein
MKASTEILLVFRASCVAASVMLARPVGVRIDLRIWFWYRIVWCGYRSVGVPTIVLTSAELHNIGHSNPCECRFVQSLCHGSILAPGREFGAVSLVHVRNLSLGQQWLFGYGIGSI